MASPFNNNCHDRVNREEMKATTAIKKMEQSLSSRARFVEMQEQVTAIMDKSHINTIIDNLVFSRHNGSAKPARLEEVDIMALITVVKQVFRSQPMLIKVNAPVNICGDIHGQFTDLLHVFDHGGHPPESNYVFMGDYVDRGPMSIECVSLLFAYKIKYPNNFIILRGNHECADISKHYGFFEECRRYYSTLLWKSFISAFEWMPIAALVEDKILCMHGGISPYMEKIESLDQINLIERPCAIPREGLMCDILWADPDHKPGWNCSSRGVSYTFGADKVAECLEKFDLDLICRAHQVVEDGYLFFADRQLVTIFSAPNYCNLFENYAAMLCVERKYEEEDEVAEGDDGDELVCDIKQIRVVDRFDMPRRLNRRAVSVTPFHCTDDDSD